MSRYEYEDKSKNFKCRYCGEFKARKFKADTSDEVEFICDECYPEA